MNNFKCDMYHLAMAQSMFLAGIHNQPAVFEMFYRAKRENPMGYAVFAGLDYVLEWLQNWGYDNNAIEQLATLEYPNGKKKFTPEFLEFIKSEPLHITVDAFREGEIIFPNEPVVRISGPAWQASIVETAFLNAVNGPTAVATKAARIVHAANGKGVMEFGLRRAPGIDGMMESRSAIIGGAIATSNVDAAMKYNIPCVGTMAHSWIMQFDTEQEAFETWLRHNPDNGVLLVDTYDTLKSGVPNAIKAAQNMNVPLLGIRLDSGDLDYLSKGARELLDKAGMNNTKIYASNDLDEYIIAELERSGAKIDVYAAGTKMVTPPAFGFVYKLKEIAGADRMKHSEDPIKSTTPGHNEVIRMLDDSGYYNGDMITPVMDIKKNRGNLACGMLSVNPEKTHLRPKDFAEGTKFFKPAVRVVERGRVMRIEQSAMEIGRQAKINLAALDDAHKRLLNPHIYVVGLEENLWRKMMRMIELNKQKNK